MSESDFMLIDRKLNHERRKQFLLRVLVIGFVFIVIFITITLIISTESPEITRPKFVTNCSIDYKYDLSLLTLYWPTTFCYNKQCVKHDNNKWLIHGLWPTYQNHSWPQFCCFDKQFKLKNLEPIMADLERDWTNLMIKDSNDSLWRHEWTKHGTCTKTKQIDYFNNTLQLYKKFPIYQWLQEAEIVPSNDQTYDLNAFNSVFHSKIGHKVQIKCIKSKNKSLLDEILICINHNQTENIIDCSEESTCKKPFYYPKSDNN